MCVCAFHYIPTVVVYLILIISQVYYIFSIRHSYIPMLFGCMWLCVSHDMCHDMHHISLFSWFNPSYNVSHFPLCIKYI